MNPGLHHHTRAFALVRRALVSSCVALSLGCGDSHSTAPQKPLAVSDIDALRVFVRNWPSENLTEYVQVDYRRIDGQSVLVLYRPAQMATGDLSAVPRLLLDSIGPQDDAPPEIVEIVNTYNVWAMADSNAAGAACSTRTGEWVCNITARDYSIVLGVETGGMRRSQRYTGLEKSTGNARARALGDFVFEWSRRHGGGTILRGSDQADGR